VAKAQAVGRRKQPDTGGGILRKSACANTMQEKDRRAALSEIEEFANWLTDIADVSRQMRWQLLDSRVDVRTGTQFYYKLNLDGKLSKNCREALTIEDFESLLDSIETQLKQMGQQIFRLC
jgi:hypothetical protein